MRRLILAVLLDLACVPLFADGHLEWVPEGYRCSVEVEGNGLPDMERPSEEPSEAPAPAPQPVKVLPAGTVPAPANSLPRNGSQVCVEVLGVVLRGEEARGVVREVPKGTLVVFRACP